jgi:uncharacterized membrane protein YvbJ
LNKNGVQPSRLLDVFNAQTLKVQERYMKNIIIILSLVASCVFVFISCATHSESILIYKGEVELVLDDNCTMAGRIVDKNTGKPLIGANIYFKNTNIAGSSTDNGNYSIGKIKPGVYDVKVSYIGFEALVVSSFSFEKSHYYLVDFELLESEPSFHILESKP